MLKKYLFSLGFPTLCLVLVMTVMPQALAQRGGGKGPKGPIGVIVAPVELKDYADRVEALGTTKSNDMVVITADTAEKVTAIHFEEGQDVKKGDLLITLAKGEEDADLKAAQAQLTEAQASYDRAKGLQESNALSKATLQERLAILKQRRAAIASITARLDKRAITAPFDGVLGLRQVSIGTLVQTGMEITTIDDISKIKVDFDVPSVFLPILKAGLKFVGHVEAFGELEFQGEVKIVNTQVDPVTRTVTVRGIIDNEDRALKPGLLMSIILLKNERQALIIPEEALLKRADKNLVYIVTNNEGKDIASEHEIEIGSRQPGDIEVLSGLNAGDEVVVHGMIKLTDGAEVSIRAEEKDNQTLDELLKQNTDIDAPETSVE